MCWEGGGEEETHLQIYQASVNDSTDIYVDDRKTIKQKETKEKEIQQPVYCWHRKFSPKPHLETSYLMGD